MPNLPSGDPTLSPLDVEVTRRLAECGRLQCFEVLGHVIVGEASRYASLKQRGML